MMLSEPWKTRSLFNTWFLPMFRNILLQFLLSNLQKREMKNALFI